MLRITLYTVQLHCTANIFVDPDLTKIISHNLTIHITRPISSLQNIVQDCNVFTKLFINNVSSSTSHNETPSFCLSLQEFKKILSNTFIYESIVIKIYMDANIRNMQLFHLIGMTSKVIGGHKRSPF